MYCLYHLSNSQMKYLAYNNVISKIKIELTI